MELLKLKHCVWGSKIESQIKCRNKSLKNTFLAYSVQDKDPKDEGSLKCWCFWPTGSPSRFCSSFVCRYPTWYNGSHWAEHCPTPTHCPQVPWALTLFSHRLPGARCSWTVWVRSFPERCTVGTYRVGECVAGKTLVVCWVLVWSGGSPGEAELCSGVDRVLDDPGLENETGLTHGETQQLPRAARRGGCLIFVTLFLSKLRWNFTCSCFVLRWCL